MSAPGAGAGNLPNIVQRYIASQPSYGQSVAAYEQKLKEWSTIAGRKVKNRNDFEFALKQKAFREHDDLANSLGMPRKTPDDKLRAYARSISLQNPALSSIAMRMEHEKIMRNIAKAARNAGRMKELEEIKRIEEIEAFLNEPNISSEEKELQEEFARIEAEEKEKENLKELLLKNQTRKMAKKFGMREKSKHKNIMNKIANTLGKPRGTSEKNLLTALRASKGVPKGMTLRQFMGKSRGGKRKTMRKRNKSRQTRRRV
jgi:hypothetical protein